MTIVEQLVATGAITPPAFLPRRVAYLCVMGSHAYGLSGDTPRVSISGVCVPPPEMTFPHLTGQISGFGTPHEPFTHWRVTHVKHPDRPKSTEYDITVYGIVRHVQLCFEADLDALFMLFAPTRCVLYAGEVGTHLRARRRLFLHKRLCATLLDAARLQRLRTLIQAPEQVIQAAETAVRLLNLVEQVMCGQDLDLESNAAQSAAIRRGEIGLDAVARHLDDALPTLADRLATCALSDVADEMAIRTTLHECLEMTDGPLNAISSHTVAALVDDLKGVIARYV